MTSTCLQLVDSTVFWYFYIALHTCYVAQGAVVAMPIYMYMSENLPDLHATGEFNTLTCLSHALETSVTLVERM